MIKMPLFLVVIDTNMDTNHRPVAVAQVSPPLGCAAALLALCEAPPGSLLVDHDAAIIVAKGEITQSAIDILRMLRPELLTPPGPIMPPCPTDQTPSNSCACCSQRPEQPPRSCS